jgi:hypothetical protein
LAICPKCQSEIEIQQQFFGGLFTCPKCQAVYFTNFDGIPEGSSAEPSVSTNQEVYSSTENQPEVAAPTTFDSPMSFEPIENQLMSPPNEQNLSADLLGSIPEEKNDLNDVVRYGNSDQVSSPISYRLTISGIDLLQNINELKEVFSDSKLQINFSDLKKRIQNGHLTLEGLTPAKSAVLAQRIRTLNLSMKWELKIYE